MKTVGGRAALAISDIPFEVVDDDELAAIETALSQVASVPPALSHSKSYPFSLNRASTYQPRRSLAESCNSWLSKCVNRPERAKSVDGGTSSVSLFRVQSTYSTTCSCTGISKTSNALEVKGQGHVCSCCKENFPHKFPKSRKTAISMSSPSVLKDSNLIVGEVSTVTRVAVKRTSQDEPPQVEMHVATLPTIRDIEDLPGDKGAVKSQKEEAEGSASPEPKPKCLSVTDFTALEWCEKQVEFTKTLGKPKQTEAMKAGSARHAELEVEVLKKVEVEITSKEDSWAMRLINFLTGARQLLSEGMTRELPVVGLIGGAWVIGIIDELKLCDRDDMHKPQLIDTKTRNKPTPPSAPQKQNGRMQLMVYKLLWDNLVTSGIPYDDFFKHFRLRPHHLLSNDIRVHAAEIFPDAEVKNLQDVARMHFQECVTFPESHSLLLLRYEWQADRSLLGQDEFDIEREWLDLRIDWHLEFWHGLREPAYVPEDETWKCRYCSFAELCPAMQALSLGTEPKQVGQISQSQKPQEPSVSGEILKCLTEPKQVDQNFRSQKPQEHSVSGGILKYFKKDTRM